ncbi:MAG TPA: SH3 domain-containing protein [Aquifex aeolicus]|uniref:SH3 domain-containing protein n=1 Tax=Aquifex aeolicus TaxID=63363 RepID=A0A7C5L8B4_AQUAO|nr:SH3 domain-containing protein [Aquifex aeolicus]
MRVVKFLVLTALAGYGMGSLVGWGLSEREVRMAMCAYYSEWEFCREVKKEERLRDLALSGLSRKVHELEMKLREREEKRENLCVKAYRLNIRLYPLDGKVIGVYRKGARVEVLDRIGGWVRTEEGWVSEKWLERCSEAAEAGGVSAGSGNSDVLRK